MNMRSLLLMAILLACMASYCQASLYSSAVTGDGAVGYWRLSEAAGSATAVNSGSAGATLDGSYGAYPPGKYDTAGLITTDPANTAMAGDAVSSGHASYIDGTGLSTAGPGGGNVLAGDWTMEAWFVRGTNLGDQGAPALFSNEKGSAPSAPLFCFGGYGIVNPNQLGMMNTLVTWDGFFGIDLGTYGSSSTDYLGKKVYAVMTKTGTNDAASVSIYANVDGTWLTPVLNHAVPWTMVPYDGFYIGRHGDAGNFFQGTIDEVAVYSGALSQSQVLAHYAVASVPEPNAMLLLAMGLIGLLAYAWRKRK